MREKTEETGWEALEEEGHRRKRRALSGTALPYPLWISLSLRLTLRTEERNDERDNPHHFGSKPRHSKKRSTFNIYSSFKCKGHKCALIPFQLMGQN